MSPSTRKRVLDYLVEHRRASAPELSRALSMTRANMRYHLEKLLADGAIEPEPPKADAIKERGRPIQVFRLSMTTRPNNLVQLANILLDQAFAGNLSESHKGPLLSKLARCLAGDEELSPRLTQRLNRAVQLLNQKRYQARWEARAAAPHVTFRNCPYAAILPDHPELCQMDALLLEYLLQLPVEQTARMDIFSGKPAACVFSIGAKSVATPG